MGPGLANHFDMDSSRRLDDQLNFLREIDSLKSVQRRSRLLNGERLENSAEHSWHVAMLAMVLAEHADQALDTNRVIRMLLVHDIVEIDAGDTFCYDEAGVAEQGARETVAARRIFGLLPPDTAEELRGLWIEFETQSTPESKFAAAVDRLMPLLHNYGNQGRSWRENGVTFQQVFSRSAMIGQSSASLWEFTQKLLCDARDQGYFAGEGNS